MIRFTLLILFCALISSCGIKHLVSTPENYVAGPPGISDKERTGGKEKKNVRIPSLVQSITTSPVNVQPDHSRIVPQAIPVLKRAVAIQATCPKKKIPGHTTAPKHDHSVLWIILTVLAGGLLFAWGMSMIIAAIYGWGIIVFLTGFALLLLGLLPFIGLVSMIFGHRDHPRKAFEEK